MVCVLPNGTLPGCRFFTLHAHMLSEDGELMSRAGYIEEDITFMAAPEFDNLIPWHTPQHKKIAPSPTGKRKMFTLSTMITIHLNSERDLLCASTLSLKKKEKTNEKRDEKV